jgi:putative polyhydroxyalkanoate system protein
MAQIHLVREHGLGLAAARRIAQDWAREVQAEYGLQCRSTRTAEGEVVQFERRGVQGTLTVTPQRFELQATLGLLLGPLRGRIEAEISRRLQDRLAAARR